MSWRVCDDVNGGLESEEGKKKERKKEIGKDRRSTLRDQCVDREREDVPKEILTPQEQLPVSGLYTIKSIGT